MFLFYFRYALKAYRFNSVILFFSIYFNINALYIDSFCSAIGKDFAACYS